MNLKTKTYTMKKISVILFVIVVFISCKEKQAQNFSGDLNIPDAIFNYSAIGQGIPCILFAGAENLDKNLLPEEFLEHFNVIGANPDHLSEEVISKLTFDDILDDIERARKYLGIDKLVVFGHSMFSTLPLDFALKYPDNVRFTILTGSAPAFNERYFQAVDDYWESFATPERKEIYLSRMDSLMATDMTALSVGEQFIKQYLAGAPKYFYNPTFDCSDAWNNVEVNINFVNYYLGKLLSNMDNSEAYKSLQVPALIISGKYDFVCPHILWDGIAEKIPNAKYVLFDNAGHNPMLEIPDEYTNTVLAWVESLK